MAYYTGLVVLIDILHVFTSQAKNEGRGRKTFFVLTCAAVVLFQGLRSFSVGTDLPTYISSYTRIGASDWGELTYFNYEAGYILLNKFLYKLGLNARGFLIAIAGIVQIPVFYTLYRYSRKPLMSVLWYFSFGNFIMTFSGLRQSIAMSLCFAAYGFIRRKQLIPFCAAILLSACFHKSALFCLVLYPIYYVKLDKKKFFLAIAALGIVFIMRNRIFVYIGSLYYGETIAVTLTGAYTMFAAYAMLFILSFHKRNPDADYIGLRNILFMLTLVYTFASLHNYVARIGYPLSLYMSLFVPQLIDNYCIKPRSVYYGLCYMFLMICFYYFLGELNTLPFSFD